MLSASERAKQIFDGLGIIPPFEEGEYKEAISLIERHLREHADEARKEVDARYFNPMACGHSYRYMGLESPSVPGECMICKLHAEISQSRNEAAEAMREGCIKAVRKFLEQPEPYWRAWALLKKQLTELLRSLSPDSAAWFKEHDKAVRNKALGEAARLKCYYCETIGIPKIVGDVYMHYGSGFSTQCNAQELQRLAALAAEPGKEPSSGH